MSGLAAFDSAGLSPATGDDDYYDRDHDHEQGGEHGDQASDTGSHTSASRLLVVGDYQ
jgi:hypothetical protein